MTAAAKGSTGAPMIFTQSEATAAQRTWLFHLVLTADQTNGTGLVPVVTISKNGAAFGAMAGAVTEIANGWYKCIFAAADLDTIGALAVLVAVATADSIMTSHQVTLFDLNTALPATVTLADGGLTAVKLAPDALAAMAGKLASKPIATVGTLTAGVTSKARSMRSAYDTVVTLAGTWNGATVKVESTEDENATVPVWTDRSAGGLTADGSVTITGPHSAWRARVSTGAVTSVVVKAADRVPVVVS